MGGKNDFLLPDRRDIKELIAFFRQTVFVKLIGHFMIAVVEDRDGFSAVDRSRKDLRPVIHGPFEGRCILEAQFLCAPEKRKPVGSDRA